MLTPTTTFSRSLALLIVGAGAMAGLLFSLPTVNHANLFLKRVHNSKGPIANSPAKELSDNAAEVEDINCGMPVLPQPEFLRGTLPAQVRSLAIQNTNIRNLKIVSWTEHFDDTHLGLVKVNGLRSVLLWQSDTKDVYCPRIEVFPDRFCQGIQVYLLRGQRGAAYEVIFPFYVQNNSLKMISTIEARGFDFERIEGKDYLLGFNRVAGISVHGKNDIRPIDYDTSFLYDFENGKIEQVNLKHRRYVLNSIQKSDSTDWSSEYNRASALFAADCKADSKLLFKHIYGHIKNSNNLLLLDDYSTKMNELSCKKEALIIAKRIRSEIVKRKIVAMGFDEKHEIGVEYVINCAKIFQELGFKSESNNLLKLIPMKVRKEYDSVMAL